MSERCKNVLSAIVAVGLCFALFYFLANYFPYGA